MLEVGIKGKEETIVSEANSAKTMGIAVIIDGVFNHTGSDSIYFNRNRRYGDGGAYNDYNSPYHSWYEFTQWPQYNSWWGWGFIDCFEG